MSGYDNEYSDLFDGDDRGRQSGSDLRKMLEESLAESRQLRKELTEERRGKQLAELFRSQGKDPAASVLVPEGADPKEWLEQNGAFVANAAKKEEPAGEAEANGEAAPEVSKTDPQLEAERAQHEQMQQVGGTGIPSTATADPIEKMKSFDNEADLLAYIQSQQ